MIGTLRRRGIHPLVLVTIATAWCLAIGVQYGGIAQVIHHDSLIEGGLPLAAALALFLLAWQAMIAAMMLPSSLPLIVLFERTSAAVPDRGQVRAAFLGGYTAVWSLFGVAAFLSDAGLHRLVDASPWLAAHPNVIAGTTLTLAGAFQFSSLKEACLRACRNPGVYLMNRYRRGARAAFRLGWGHGIFCLGCCWALMLVAFAMGMANLWWMVGFTALMVFEKVGRHGDRAVAPIGIGLISAGALMILGDGLPSF